MPDETVAPTRLAIHHRTSYRFAGPMPYAVQQLRLWPKSRAWQRVIDWTVDVDGGVVAAEYEDEHHNHVQLVTVNAGAEAVNIRCDGIIETEDHSGLVGAHRGPAPLWLYQGTTAVTTPGRGTRAIARAAGDGNAVARLHRLSAAIRDAISYEIGATDAGTTAEEALALGQGVCQDHAHSFIAAARLLGFPARYISGYLLMDDRVEQDATHGWAEAHIDNLGWVGFDISNGISPDHRYVRVATGRDYREAAPVRGINVGQQGRSLDVRVSVEQ